MTTGETRAVPAVAAGPGAPRLTRPPGAGSGDERYVVPPPGSPAYAAARRFAALPAAVRHGWLTQHLAALRAGRISLGQLP